MINVGIKSERNGKLVEISKRGQLVTAPLDFSTFYQGSTASNNVAVNVVGPKAGSQFIITDIILAGDRSIGANGAVVDIFENSVGPTDGTITKQIYQDEIAKQTRAVLTGLNLIVSAGRWVNVKSDDVIVRCNIAGYYAIEIDGRE